MGTFATYSEHYTYIIAFTACMSFLALKR